MVGGLKGRIPLPLRRAGRSAVSATERLALELGVLPGTPVPASRVERFAELPPESGCRVVALEPRPAEGRRGSVRALGAPIPGFPDHEVPGEPPLPSVALLDRGVVLSGDGLVATSRGEIVLESVWDDRLVSPVIARRRLRRTERLRGHYGSLVTPWGSNHFHWLIDGLPRLALLEEAGLGGLPLLVSGPLDTVRRDALELVGADAEAAVAVAEHPVCPDRLAWAAPLSWTGYPLGSTCAWLRERLAPDAPAGGSRGIYVSRTQARWRRVANEYDLIRELTPLGIEPVHLEDLTLREQVELFARTRVVVAPHGAGLTNLVFGRNASVLEVFPPHWHVPAYARLAVAAGHDYAYAVADTSSGDAVPAALQDVVMPVEDVVAWVDSALRADLSALPG